MESRLKLLEFSHKNKDRREMWLCECLCGNKKIIQKRSVIYGKTKSCGCMQKERISKIGKDLATHKMSGTRTYSSWYQMKHRCDNKNSVDFERYGGRGIKYDRRWKKFENFLEDMGERPNGMSIDRIDNNKGYSKENCRWSTSMEQMNNRRCSKTVVFNGIKKTLTEWGRELGIPKGTIFSRYYSKAYGKDRRNIAFLFKKNSDRAV